MYSARQRLEALWELVMITLGLVIIFLPALLIWWIVSGCVVITNWGWK